MANIHQRENEIPGFQGVHAADRTAANAFRHRVADTRPSSPILDNPPTVDPDYKAIRVTEMRDDGFVEFEFTVGDPDIFAEMLLNRPAFERFCQEQGVTPTFEASHAADESGLGTTLREVLARTGHAPTHKYKDNQEG